MGVSEIGLLLLIWVFQETAPVAPPVKPVEPELLMAQAQEAFANGRYKDVPELLKPLVADGLGEAMLLAADAHYELGSEVDIRHAITLYERCLYEDNTIPFPDHSYYQLAQIYTDASQKALAKGSGYEAQEMAFEAQFYLKRLVKKFPNSYYRDTALNQLLTLNERNNNDAEVLRMANSIWDVSVNGRLLTRVEPIVFIHQDPFNASLAELEEVFQRHAATIATQRGLLLAYAQKFEQLGALDRARQLYLQIYNLWPRWPESAGALRRLADLHRAQAQYPEAAFLYKLILMDSANTPAEAEAWLGIAEMMELGHIYQMKLANGQLLTYRDLIDRIRLSSLPDHIRARYHYKRALLESFVNPDRSLLIMRSLLDEYKRGPLVGLYRKFYEQLLFATINAKYEQGQDWELDRLYRQHYQFLAFTTQTVFPSKIAKAYIRLDLPSSAIQVYENLWNYKNAVRGFDLAFEEPLTDFLFLLDRMRLDSKLKFRLVDYRALYGDKDRFPDRWLYLKTRYESRHQEPDAFLEFIKKQPTEIRTLYDAKRLREMLVFVQEGALRCQADRLTAKTKGDAEKEKSLLAQERSLWGLTERLYADVGRWPNLAKELPQLFHEARLFRADYLFHLGNYFESEKLYQDVLADTTHLSSDRDWAYLQLGRLHELTGGLKTSLRIYGQLAYAKDEDSKMLAAYAKQRLAGLASTRKLHELEQETDLGSF